MTRSSEFALDLHSRLPASGNLFYSPFSLRSALAMAQAGAAGETASEMAEVLRLGEADDWAPAAAGVTLRSGNALWADEALRLKAAYARLCEERFGGRLSPVPFAKDPQAAVGTINAWVSERTEGLIPALLDSVSPDTRLVLTNAVYFKGVWEEPFLPDATIDLPFRCEGGKEVEARMMQRSGEYRYAALDGLQLIELPYSGGEVSMLVLLPSAKDGLPALERRLTPEALAGWSAAARTMRVVVLLPRFKLEEQVRTVEPLKDLGLRAAFTAGADFSAMSDGDRLFISDVVHKAFVEVGEEGTEAAAATAVVESLGCDMSEEQRERPPVFEADHPFLFLIRDGKGEVLFVGRLARP